MVTSSKLAQTFRGLEDFGNERSARIRLNAAQNQAFMQHFHKYITKNSEYVLSGDWCVEVRARGSRDALAAHRAVQKHVQALVRWSRDGAHQVLRGQPPKVGDSLVFDDGKHELLTTVIRRIVALSDNGLEPSASR